MISPGPRKYMSGLASHYARRIKCGQMESHECVSEEIGLCEANQGSQRAYTFQRGILMAAQGGPKG